LIRGKRSHLHRANKKATRNFDANKLDEIQTSLNECRLSFVREEPHQHPNYHTQNKTRIPDFRFKTGNKTIVLEEDSNKYHGDFPYQNTETKRRNLDHLRAGYGISILSRDLAKQLKLPVGPLAVYLYYHAIVLLEAFSELRAEMMY